MARLIFLNRFFFPDQSATSQILSDLAFYLAACGSDVHVVTSRQLYEDPKARLPIQETVRGVTIHRVFSTRFGRTSLAGRALDYLSYYACMMFQVLKLARAGDVVIAKTDPPLISILAMGAARIRRAKLVNWTQDIYPEVAIETGVPLLKGQIGRLLSFLRDKSLKAAVANIAVGERMAARLQSRYASSDRVHVIPNWCDDEEIIPVPHADNLLRQAWDLQNKFVVGYSGNLGRAHEFETLLAASERFREDPNVIFLLIGGGQRFEELKQIAKMKGLDSIYRFFPYQERKHLKYSLSAPDLHWISLKPELEGLIFPSKFYGIAAAGRPMIAITAPDGEIADLIRKHACGIVVTPGDAAELAATISKLAEDSVACNAMGLRARAMLEAHFTRAQALAHWQRLLAGI